MSKYTKKNKLLQKEANEILSDLQLVELLKKYGRLKIVGSLALGLMSWKDIDLLVETKPSYNDCLEVVNYLFKIKKVYNLHLQDFRKSVFIDRPKGIYIGIKYLNGKTKDDLWKIDVWFMETSKTEQTLDFVKENLTNDTRKIILEIKNEIRKKAWGKKISGLDVYKAVLSHEVKTLEEFKQYLKNQNKTVWIDKKYKF